MTYVVDEKCIKCKTTDCVEVCPVNCFYEGENMLVIHPTSASTAVFVNPSALSMQSNQTAKRVRRSGSSLTVNTR